MLQHMQGEDAPRRGRLRSSPTAVHSTVNSAEKCHDLRTTGPLGMQMRGDLQNAARVKRIMDKRETAAEIPDIPPPSTELAPTIPLRTGKTAGKKKLQGQGFPKGHRPMPGSRKHPSGLRKRMNREVDRWPRTD
jgi:hypothetical protein